jgi:sensor histidine kinase YesM
VWAALGLLESGKAYVMSRAVGQPAAAAQVLVGNLPWWLFWGALTPAVFALCRRWGFFVGERWGRALLVHVPAALLLSVLHLTVTAAVFQRTSAPDAVLGRMWTMWLNSFLFLELFTYGLIVVGYHALVHYRLYRERQDAAARLELEQERLGREMARAKLQALQMELQPHFLFNTFNAITALVRRNENRAAVEMLVRLGELLRRTLERGGTPQVTLAEEVELARCYLGIQQVRFPGLEVEVHIDARAGRALVPTLVLQPLIENAVRHGLAGSGTGTIRVCGSIRGDRLTVEVEDTGHGPGGPPPTAGNGVGLGNTRSRLEQLWNGDARLDLVPLAGGGTRVVLEVPHTTHAEVGRVPRTR